MNRIEHQMVNAIMGGKNWSNSNTMVTTDQETNTSSVYLHGNLIATVTDNDMTIYDGGRQSNTTKSRLNALCFAFCDAGEGVFQQNFKWFVRKFVGQAGQSKVYNVCDFENGYVFS